MIRTEHRIGHIAGVVPTDSAVSANERNPYVFSILSGVKMSMTPALTATYPPQPHAEQQAEEGEGCEGLAEHWYDIVREG